MPPVTDRRAVPPRRPDPPLLSAGGPGRRCARRLGRVESAPVSGRQGGYSSAVGPAPPGGASLRQSGWHGRDEQRGGRDAPRAGPLVLGELFCSEEIELPWFPPGNLPWWSKLWWPKAGLVHGAAPGSGTAAKPTDQAHPTWRGAARRPVHTAREPALRGSRPAGCCRASARTRGRPPRRAAAATPRTGGPAARWPPARVPASPGRSRPGRTPAETRPRCPRSRRRRVGSDTRRPGAQSDKQVID